MKGQVFSLSMKGQSKVARYQRYQAKTEAVKSASIGAANDMNEQSILRRHYFNILELHLWKHTIQYQYQ